LSRAGKAFGPDRPLQLAEIVANGLAGGFHLAERALDARLGHLGCLRRSNVARPLVLGLLPRQACGGWGGHTAS
jgi:hypothetical protein